MLLLLKRSFIIFIILFLPLAKSFADTSERIKAVSEFLLDRFQANYVYMIEQGMRENPVFKCYFPNTYQYIKDYELSVLLMGGDDIWQASVNKDIKSILENTKDRLVYSGSHKLVTELLDKYSFIHFLKMIEVEGETLGAYETLYTLKLNNKKSFHNALKEVFVKYNKLSEYRDYFDGCKFNDKNDTADKKVFWFFSINDDSSSRKEAEKAVVSAMTDLNTVIKGLNKRLEQSGIRFNQDYETLKAKLSFNSTNRKLHDAERKALDKLNLMESEALKYIIQRDFSTDERLRLFKQDFKKIADLSGFIQNKMDQIKKIPTAFKKKRLKNGYAEPDNNLLRVIEAERVIREYVGRKMGGIRVSVNSKDYRDFTRYIIFFAQLSQVSNGEDAGLLLKHSLLPPVSFGTKRKSGEAHLLLTAYLGAAAYGEDDKTSNTDKEDVQYSSLFAPLGLEYSVGIGDGGSLSFMLAPFDFAYPLSLESQNSDKEVEFSDIVVPGLYLSYGFQGKPISVGIGVSRGRPLRSDSEREERVLVFIAMDMPLFQLY